MASETAAPTVTGKSHGVRLGIVHRDIKTGDWQGTPKIGRSRCWRWRRQHGNDVVRLVDLRRDTHRSRQGELLNWSIEVAERGERSAVGGDSWRRGCRDSRWRGRGITRRASAASNEQVNKKRHGCHQPVTLLDVHALQGSGQTLLDRTLTDSPPDSPPSSPANMT
jgi:hypothetical protein